MMNAAAGPSSPARKRRHEAARQARAWPGPAPHRRAFGYRRGPRHRPGPLERRRNERSRLAAARQRTSRRSPSPRQTGDQMKFLLQVRFNGADTVIGELPAQEQQKVTAEFETIRRSPGVLDGNQLQTAGTAATVRMDGGQ